MPPLHQGCEMEDACYMIQSMLGSRGSFGIQSHRAGGTEGGRESKQNIKMKRRVSFPEHSGCLQHQIQLARVGRAHLREPSSSSPDLLFSLSSEEDRRVEDRVPSFLLFVLVFISLFRSEWVHAGSGCRLAGAQLVPSREKRSVWRDGPCGRRVPTRSLRNPAGGRRLLTWFVETSREYDPSLPRR